VTGAALNTLIDRFLDEPSLQAAHENLRGILAREQKRFLVVLDDIDRLRKDEIRSIMQMVKTVGRLPNVVYLLAYDREIVWPALDESTSVKSSGPNFAEKIVQQEVALPRPATEDLLGILDSEIAFLLGASTSEGRWYNLVADGIRRWIRHPRDVQRLANAVKFSWPALEGEIDPQDLLIMEGLRLFDNLVFEWIRWNKDWLFDEGSYLMAREETKKAWLNSLTDQIPERERERVIRLLAVLFPGQHEVFGKDFREEANWSLVARRGIGSGAGFDAYFSLFPSPNEVPKTVIDMAIAKLNERSFLVDLIDSYVQKTDRNNLSMVPKLLRELAFRFMGRNAVVVPTQDLFEALFEKADDIFSIDWRADPLQLSPNAALIDLSDQMLELWGPDAAAQHLESAFSKSCSLVLSADIFVDQARDFGILPDRSGRRPRIAQDALEALGKILLPQLQQAARDSTLVSAPNFFGIIPAWKYLGGAAAVKKWIEANIQSNPEFLSKLTKGFVS
jgi:predicted KAP-like P-loop ATPase